MHTKSPLQHYTAEFEREIADFAECTDIAKLQLGAALLLSYFRAGMISLERGESLLWKLEVERMELEAMS